MRKESESLITLRYVSVSLVTLALVTLLIVALCRMPALFFFLSVLLVIGFFITIPALALWCYSLVRSLGRRTETDRILLHAHIADIAMLLIIIWATTRPDFRCDANVMDDFAQRHSTELQSIAADAKAMLPDTANYSFESDKSYRASPLDEKQIKELKKRLSDIGCIGISINNIYNRPYTSIRFRREGMDMYSFRIYDTPLSQNEIDSLNDECELIVHDSRTVFEYGSGAFGSMDFPGKEKYENSRRPAARQRPPLPAE